MKTRFAVEQRMDVPADAVYHCLVDYREHHRPGGFLPPAFSDQDIERGGIGDGTQLRYDITLGGRRREVRASVREAIVGREIVETGPGLQTTMTVEPRGEGTTVRFETEIDEPGMLGVVGRLFAARLLVPIYRDELRRLEGYARAHSSAWS